jgi:hypothetical protein
MVYSFIGIVFLLCLFLQGTLTNLPLLLVFLLLIYIYYRQDWVFLLAFFAGIALDIVTVRVVGGSSIFFLLFLVSVFLYQRKFEIGSPLFVFLALFLGTLIYAGIFGYPDSFLMALLLGVVGIGCFGLLRKMA